MTRGRGGPFTLAALAERIGARVDGDGTRELRGVATLDEARPDELSFLTNPRYRDAAAASAAGALLVAPDAGIEGRDLLVADEPYLALATALEEFAPLQSPVPGVSADARVGRDVELGEGVRIEAFVVIGDRTRIGAGCEIGAGAVVGDDCEIGPGSRLRPRVVLEPGTRVGARCLLHPGVVLGADGYGFATADGRHRKIPQLGTVVIEDDVEIGANSTVDRAMLGETRIGEGSKLDDQVMVAHGVRLGAHALIAAQSGVAGSARLGARATIAGQSGVAGHLEVGDGLILAAKSALFEDRPDGGFVAGVPATDHLSWKRSQAALRRLPALLRDVRAMRTRLEALEPDDGGEA